MFLTIDSGLSRSLRSYTWLVILIWSGAILVSLFLNLRKQEQQVLAMAKTQARISFQRDMVYRYWVASHGGVYAPVTPNTPSNPYLNVPERDITTTSGHKLTLINPAYMSRQVNDLARGRYRITSHLTSLQPLRPENAPDPWEREALLALKQGEKEVWSLRSGEQQKELCMMFPLPMEEKCLKCHGHQGYKVGDIRGGLSITVPLSQWAAIIEGKYTFFGHLGLWGLGVALIGGGSRRLRRAVDRQFQTEDALKESEEKYRLLVENQQDLMIKVDAEGKLLFASRTYCDLFGKDEAELLAEHCLAHVHEEDYRASLQAFQQVLMAPYTGYREERTLTKSGWRWLSWSEKGVPDARGKVTVVSVGRDITEQKEAEAQVQRLAYYDLLTGLPNRTLFADRLGQALGQAAREKRIVSIVFLDLDRFNIINDTLGHAVGDELLKAVASRLQQRVRKTDTVARLGGDEFIVVLPAVRNEKDIITVVQNLLEVVKQPITVAGQEIYSTASVGIAVYPLDGHDLGTLLQHAEVAMYKGKEQGGNTYQFYCREMHVKAMDRLVMERNLRRALEKQEFSLHWQPKVGLPDGRITGAEVLLRWKNDELGDVSPDRFIPVAEETGLIIGIGRWVLETACRQNKAWQDVGFPPIPVAVNISGCQLKHRGFIEEVAEVLAYTGLPADCLELELTESILMDNVAEATRTLHQLKDLGVQISIDDFGTGYSSLNYLKRFPLDKLKIDRSFVMDIPACADDAAIARAIIAMSHSLHLKVIAEGVETAEQLEFLSDGLCDEIQGYHISRPLPVQEFMVIYRRLAGAEVQTAP